MKIKPKVKVAYQNGVTIMHSATHHYRIHFNHSEKEWQVNILCLHTQKHTLKAFRTVDEAMEWVQLVHVPEKLNEWICL